jgi:tetratricopeptide (TPR) repeat protein
MHVKRIAIVLVVTLCIVVGEAPAQAPDADDLRSPSWWLKQASDAAERVDLETLDDLSTVLLQLQAQAGEMKAAEETAARLRAEWGGNELEFSRQLVETYAGVGRIDEALDIAEKAAARAPAEDQRRVASMYVEIVREQADAGKLDEAKALAHSIDEPEYRARALAIIAYVEAELDLDGALETFQSAPTVVELSVLGLAPIARQAGRWDLLSQIIEMGLRQAEEASFMDSGRIYQNVAQMLAQTDLEKLDAELVEQVRRALVDYAQTPRQNDVRLHEYEEGIEAAGWGLVSLGMFDEVRGLMEKVNAHGASVLNMKLAVALAEEGRYDEAIEAAQRDSHVRRAFREVATVQANRGDFDAAKQSAGRCQDQEERNRSYHEIAGIQARAGEFAAAKETIESIRPVRGPGHVLATADYYQVAALTTIAREQRDAGEEAAAQTTLAAALEVARSSENEVERFKLMIDVARGLAETGDFEQARRLAEEIGSSDVLIELAEAHLAAGRRQEFEGALRAAQQVTTGDLGGEGEGVSRHGRIAMLLLRVDRPDEAERTMRGVLDGARQMEPSMSIFKLLAYAVAASFYEETDQLDELWRYIAALEAPLERAYASSATAMALLEPERFGDAWSDEGEGR